MMEEFRVDPGRIDLFKMMPTSPGDAFGLPGHGLEVKLETAGRNSKCDTEIKANTPACACKYRIKIHVKFFHKNG